MPIGSLDPPALLCWPSGWRCALRVATVGESVRVICTLLACAAVVGCVDQESMGRIAGSSTGPSAHAPSDGPVAPAPEDLPPDGVLHLAYAPVATELDQDSWTPLSDHLVRRLGVLIEPVPFDSYGEIVEAVANNEVELALLAPLSYVLAKEREPGLEPMVQTLSEGKTSYSAYLFVERSSRYREVDELRGARVAFVDERSTSGFLLPYDQLLDAGLEPELDLAEIIFTGDHVSTLRAVAEGRADAAASYADVIPWAAETARDEGWELPAFRLLGNAGRIPLDVLCVSPGVGESVRIALHDELLRANTSSAVGRDFFHSSGRIVGWADTDDAHYEGVREVHRRVQEHREDLP